MHYKLIVQYDGTDFLGWQLQPQGPTVQGALESAVQRLFGAPARVTAAGRTDAGVHALGQVACFRALKAMPVADLQRALNALTPDGIAIAAVEVVADDFDPRRHASSRTYCYRLWRPRWRSPFWHRYSWHVCAPLDVDALRTAAAALIGEHDFTSFQAADCDADHAIRRVLRSDFSVEPEQLVYTVEATAFVRHMVRNLIGTLIEVGDGTRSVAQFRDLLGQRDRRQAGPTAPAQGLCLMAVTYER
ncbi:MAG: tRNA pseudouridine(38-40) synthase TruA [Deltaproteobacteria bacterium]|nr:tRNA pseudouridine(38-40) synthase TruA [Deltaproteobacteria bacterium]MBI3388637.1 tRNA pseudouridine(38-40) synthase TruA [Deltaproteobacteria bacterium]